MERRDVVSDTADRATGISDDLIPSIIQGVSNISGNINVTVNYNYQDSKE